MLLAVESDISGVDPFLLLLVALALDALLGGFVRSAGATANPLAPMAGAAAWLHGKLDRERRSDRDRFVRGLLVAALLTGAAVAAGVGVGLLLRALPFGWVVEIPLIMSLIAQRRPFERARRVAAAVARGGGADGHGIARTTVETCAATFATGLVGPAFWYLLLGLPGLFAYRTVRMLDRTGGRRDGAGPPFVRAAAVAAAVLGFLPSRFAAAYIALAAVFAPGGDPVSALRTAVADAPGHPMGAAAWPVAAAAGALDLALAGPAGRAGTPWLGGGRARATAADLRRALYLYAVACLLHAVAVGLLGALLWA